MAARYLGETFDLHGGGVDLIFPHHENERAQSQGACGPGTFSRYWLHNGFVNFNGRKIAKSDEELKALMPRVFQLRALVDKMGGEAIRFFLLTTQYHNPINHEVIELPGGEFGFPALEEADRQLEYGYLTRRRLAEQLAVGKPAGPGAVAEGVDTWFAELDAALDDDFNTAGAIAALQQGLGLANRLLDGKLACPKDVKRRSLERLGADLAAASSRLGVFESDPASWLASHRSRRASQKGISAADVETKIAERAAARAAKDFAKSDELRDALKAIGVELMDGPSGTTWRVAD
jgi:cysteinyl-tRNA synthetase